MVALCPVPFVNCRRVGQTVVFLLLAWTALDVLNPALCGLDELPFVAEASALGSNNSVPTVPPIPSEDCFCCSHNVNLTSMIDGTTSLSTDGDARAVLTQNPRWTSFPLYHPPRLLS